MAWCGYKGIIRGRPLLTCLQRTLFSRLLLRLLVAQRRRRVGTEARFERITGSLDCRCVSGCAQDLLVFPLLREKPRGLCCLVSLPPIGNDSLPRSVGVFLSLFCLFFPLDTSELDFVFFPRMMSFSSSLCLEYCSTLKRWGILPCYASMLHFAVL